MSEEIKELNKDNNKSDEENNINEEEEDDIDSTNNQMDKLTFGCSNSSFKTPQVNTINFDTMSNKNENEFEGSEIYGINDEFKNIQSISNAIRNTIEEKLMNNKRGNYMNNITENNLNNIEENNVNNFEYNNNFEIENNEIISNNRINTINSMNTNNDNQNKINQSLIDLIQGNKNKNEIISIHSTKNDLTSFGSNNMFRSGNQVNGTLINKINVNKYNNDIISLNSKMSYNETNNDTESIDQSLMNLIANKNDNISLKSKKEYKNIQEMIDDYEIKKEKEKINKKISRSGFIHIYEDNKRNKNNKHIQIIDKFKKNEGEKIYIFKNNELSFNNQTKLEIPKKNRIDEVKYYEILMNDNKKINRKIHCSQIFSNLKKSNEKNYLYD